MKTKIGQNLSKSTQVTESLENNVGVIGSEWFPVKDKATVANEIKEFLKDFYGKKTETENAGLVIKGTNPDGFVFSIDSNSDGDEIIVDVGYDTDNEGDISESISGAGLSPYDLDGGVTETMINKQANYLLAFAGYGEEDFFEKNYPVLDENSARKKITTFIKEVYAGEDNAEDTLIGRIDEDTYFKITYSQDSDHFNLDIGGEPDEDDSNELQDIRDGGVIDLETGNNEKVIKDQVEYIMDLLGY